MIWNRTIEIHRRAVVSGVGPQSYRAPLTETVVLAAGKLANIQPSSGVERFREPLPTDARTRFDWLIYVPRGQIAAGAMFFADDIIVDDLSRRFQVVVAYPHLLGWRFQATLLEL